LCREQAIIHVVEQVRLEVPVAVAWAWLADLERLVTVNMFHCGARYEGAQRRGAGTRLVVDHRFFAGPVFPRLVRITHWEEPRRIGWVEIDPAHARYFFPHSEQFRLTPLGPDTTLLTDEIRGSLNLPIGERPADRLLTWLTVRRAVQRQCIYFARQIQLPAAVPVG
jgi:hypothetical protein